MANISIELQFPDEQSVRAWLASTPPHGFDFDFAEGFIPNDAPKPGVVQSLSEMLQPANPLLAKFSADGWDASAAIAHAHSFGARGRAVLMHVPYQWADEDDDPRDREVHVLLLLDDEGIDSKTLSGRQAKAYLQEQGVPPLKQLKAKLKKR